MKLYEFGPTRSIRARWTLQELGVEFESVVVNLVRGDHRRPEFLALNPAGKLPVLVDGDLVLNESVAIALYLADKYADRGFLPRDVAGRGEVYRWLLFAATELEQPLWRIARNTRLYPEERRQPTDVAIAGEEFQDMAAVLDARLRGREFVAGKHVTVADFVTAYTLDWANTAGLLGRFPGLVDYMERMYARPKAPLRIAAAFAAIEAA
jgi:glutathione S-transferase